MQLAQFSMMHTGGGHYSQKLVNLTNNTSSRAQIR